jgi:hypothetical protein
MSVPISITTFPMLPSTHRSSATLPLSSSHHSSPSAWMYRQRDQATQAFCRGRIAGVNLTGQNSSRRAAPWGSCRPACASLTTLSSPSAGTGNFKLGGPHAWLGMAKRLDQGSPYRPSHMQPGRPESRRANTFA